MATTEENEPAPKPSQAEGDRTSEAETRNQTQPAPKPSQAEGDRETIEADIRQKEKEGEL
jgi:hypothetical protein